MLSPFAIQKIRCLIYNIKLNEKNNGTSSFNVTMFVKKSIIKNKRRTQINTETYMTYQQCDSYRLWREK